MFRFITIVLMCVCDAASALPIDLSNAVYNTSAFAEVGADADGLHADSSPPSPLPIFSHAEIFGADPNVNEFATADAIADHGFLSVATEVQSSLQNAGAVAEASLETALAAAGSYLLQLDFKDSLDLIGAQAGSVLGLALSVGSRTLFDEIFTDSALISRLFVLAPGELGLLHLSLISTADSFVDGSGDALYAFNLASVNVALSTSVPSPSPLFLIGAALLPVVRLRRARRV